MEFLPKKLKRGGWFSRNSVAVVCSIFISVFILLILLDLSLPEATPTNGKRVEKAVVGFLGEMMVEMLPDDLAFTIFVPSDEAFESILKLRANESLSEEKMKGTFAILSRVMGFSAVPRHLPSASIPLRKEVPIDSISGFTLYVWKDFDGTLVANNVRSEMVDLRSSEIIVHVMSGVIMDAEFEQSFSPD